jgi:hypothetical protein
VSTDDDQLNFCWDEAKAASNLKKHGVAFESATFVFDDPMALVHEDVFAPGEPRNIIIGLVDDELLTVVFSCPEEALYRIISARPSTPRERRTYEQSFFQS